MKLKYSLFKLSICSSIVVIFLFEFPYLSSKYKAFVSNVSDVLFENSINNFVEFIILKRLFMFTSDELREISFLILLRSSFCSVNDLILSCDDMSWLDTALISFSI